MLEEITKDTETTEVAEKTVPYERFKLVNEERNTYKTSVAEKDNQINALTEKLKAYIGKEPYVSAKTPWMGSYSLDVGQYIRVSTVYGSKMSDKEDGLDGRSFDKTTKTWTFPLLPKEASDGKKLATVKDLLKYFGKDAEADKLFGA